MPRAHDRTNALRIKEFQEIEGWTPGRGNAAVVCKVQERVQSLAAFDARLIGGARRGSHQGGKRNLQEGAHGCTRLRDDSVMPPTRTAGSFAEGPFHEACGRTLEGRDWHGDGKQSESDSEIVTREEDKP